MAKQKKQRELSDTQLASRVSWKRDWKKNRMIYLLFLPIAIYLIIFNYIPMTGILMAFEDYSVRKGWFHSEWVGLENFVRLFSGSGFLIAFRNTAIMSVLNLTLGFFPPIILAILFSECKWIPFRRFTQIISYVPNFISTVVVCNLVQQFVGKDGAITLLLSNLFGLPNQNWLADSDIPVFWIIFVIMNIWIGMGWGSIIQTTTIANINGDLIEAAALDGANRWERIKNIVIPALIPICMMNLTMSVGTVLMTGWDKILIMYMPSTYNVSDVLYTYTYRMAFGSKVDYGLSTASGLFQSVLGTILLVISNKLSTKTTGYGLY
ncbi:MAG: ABC transporter permease subunit [Clostridiales bacterium]|nr:ABC transporter permease subunit [Clostridiales bacterium]